MARHLHRQSCLPMRLLVLTLPAKLLTLLFVDDLLHLPTKSAQGKYRFLFFSFLDYGFSFLQIDSKTKQQRKSMYRSQKCPSSFAIFFSHHGLPPHWSDASKVLSVGAWTARTPPSPRLGATYAGTVRTVQNLRVPDNQVFVRCGKNTSLIIFEIVIIMYACCTVRSTYIYGTGTQLSTVRYYRYVPVPVRDCAGIIGFRR